MKTIKFGYTNYIHNQIIGNLLFRKENQKETFENQITNFEINNLLRRTDIWRVNVDLSNITFGLWYDGQVVMIYADRISIDSRHSNCILIENPFQEYDSNYLIIKNKDTNILIKGARRDLSWNESIQLQYTQLFQNNTKENSDEFLFIINIKDKKIPKFIDASCIDVQTIIDNYRLKYYIAWSYCSDSLDKYKDIIDNLDDKALTSVTSKLI